LIQLRGKHARFFQSYFDDIDFDPVGAVSSVASPSEIEEQVM
jgi:hypothetical protein